MPQEMAFTFAVPFVPLLAAILIFVVFVSTLVLLF